MKKKNGEGQITKLGYKRIRVPDGRRIFEHRYVIEKIIGRRLKRGEVVHHKDKNRLNNAPENLELITHSQHMKQYHRKPTIINWEEIELNPIRYKRVQSTCFLENCENKRRTRGLCRKHYDTYWHWKFRKP